MSELRIYELKELWQKYCMSDEQLPYLLVSYQAYTALAEKVERYEKALQFYAELMDWDRVNNPACIQDKGKVARQALNSDCVCDQINFRNCPVHQNQHEENND